MVEFPYKSSTEVPKHQSKHIPAASVANASGSLQTPLSELTRRSDFHLFYQDYRAASLPIECWSFRSTSRVIFDSRRKPEYPTLQEHGLCRRVAVVRERT